VPRRLVICSVVVAVIGLVSALLIYVTAGADGEADENVQILVVDGKTYRVPLASTKTYQRELRRFGGEAAVLFDDINRWVAGRWRGRSLAITVAWITAAVSLGLLFLARRMRDDPSSDAGGDEREPG
jgi:hypothetical protein